MSKFPSIEEIDQDLAGGGTSDQFEGDDFISRERALLGEDAEAFASDQPTAEDADVAGFESSFPPLENNTNESTMISAPSEPEPIQQATEQVRTLNLDESEPIKEWKARRELEIQRRDELSEAKRKETQEKAKKAIDDFYENYNGKKDNSIEQTRKEESKFLEERDESVEGRGNTWQRIVKLVDISDTKSGIHDKTRFKELLVSLKNDANAPGAGGY